MHSGIVKLLINVKSNFVPNIKIVLKCQVSNILFCEMNIIFIQMMYFILIHFRTTVVYMC